MNRKKWYVPNEICFKLLVVLPGSAVKGAGDENYSKAYCIFLLQ